MQPLRLVSETPQDYRLAGRLGVVEVPIGYLRDTLDTKAEKGEQFTVQDARLDMQCRPEMSQRDRAERWRWTRRQVRNLEGQGTANPTPLTAKITDDEGGGAKKERPKAAQPCPKAPPKQHENGDIVPRADHPCPTKNAEIEEGIPYIGITSNPPLTPPCGGGEREDEEKAVAKPHSFEEFWSVWPKKVAKKDAAKAWAKLDPSPDLAARIIADVSERLRRGRQWQTRQFIPYPATYLNGDRWEDEIEEATPSTSPLLGVDLTGTLAAKHFRALLAAGASADWFIAHGSTDFKGDPTYALKRYYLDQARALLNPASGHLQPATA